MTPFGSNKFLTYWLRVGLVGLTYVDRLKLIGGVTQLIISSGVMGGRHPPITPNNYSKQRNLSE